MHAEPVRTPQGAIAQPDGPRPQTLIKQQYKESKVRQINIEVVVEICLASYHEPGAMAVAAAAGLGP